MGPDGAAQVGAVHLELGDAAPGIGAWALSAASSSQIDGLPTREAAPVGEPPAADPRHPNTAIRIDHLVVFTPDLKRTVTALEGEGADLRRLRDATEPGPPLRQAFFRLGEVILEVAENPRGGEGPASFWGLTFCVADLGRCAAVM